jgi:hypothetical protein
MSAIPPDIIGSAAQAGVTQREASRVQEADRAGQSHAARSQARAADEASSNVETTDDDTQIFTDAEGSGSQGRTVEDGAESVTEMSPSELPTADPGGVHLDIEA